MKFRNWKLVKNRQKYEEGLSYRLWYLAKQRAFRKNLEFTIQPHDVVIPATCPYLKKPLVPKTAYAPSIDRVDNTRGYVKDNIEIISKRANAMKNDANVEDLLEFAYEILERF